MSLSVKVGPLFGTADSPIGPVETEVPGVWRVDVYHENLPNGHLHVGMIGRQDGANFCENDNFREFTREQKDEIIAEVKRQHGSASTVAPMQLPEPIDFDDPDGEEDTDIE